MVEQHAQFWSDQSGLQNQALWTSKTCMVFKIRLQRNSLHATA